METKTQWYLPLIKKMEVYGMEMVLLVIVLAAGMLWLGFMGHERAKSSGDEACGNPILHVAIAAIAGFAALILAGNLGGELWGLLAATAVFFGVLYYFLMDAVQRANRGKIAQLERKIDQLAELLAEGED